MCNTKANCEHAGQGPPPCPTASTPSIIPNEQRRLAYSRHERSQSVTQNYSKQFPTTWAHARKQPPQPLGNIDEALIWIQQNNRLVQDNQRLKKELDAALADKVRLAETLAQTEQELQQLQQQLSNHSMSRQDEQDDQFKRTLRRVQTEERARWAEVVENLEQEVRQLRLAWKS